MDFLKNIVVGFVVLVISAAIFYFLVNEEKKDDILRTTLQALGSEALARIPEGAQKALLEQKFREFINKAENNELSERQIQITTASLLNLGLDAKHATPEAVEAFIKVHLDSMTAQESRTQAEKKRKSELEVNKRELAQEIRQMMSLQKEIKRVGAEDSASTNICDMVMFSADSGLKVWISPEIMEEHALMHNQDLQKTLQKLEQENVVRYYDFDQLNELALLGLKFAAPFLSPKDEQDIMAALRQYAPMDSLSSHQNVPHPDSIEKVIDLILTTAKQLQGMGN